MDHHSENFEKIKVQLHEQGNGKKDVTITSEKAMILGVLYALPFVVLGFGIVCFIFIYPGTVSFLTIGC